MEWATGESQPFGPQKNPDGLMSPGRIVLCNAHSQERRRTNRPRSTLGVTGQSGIVHGASALSSTAANA